MKTVSKEGKVKAFRLWGWGVIGFVAGAVGSWGMILGLEYFKLLRADGTADGFGIYGYLWQLQTVYDYVRWAGVLSVASISAVLAAAIVRAKGTGAAELRADQRQ